MAHAKAIEAARDLLVALLGSSEASKALPLNRSSAEAAGTSLGVMFTALVNAIDGVMLAEKRDR